MCERLLERLGDGAERVLRVWTYLLVAGNLSLQGLVDLLLRCSALGLECHPAWLWGMDVPGIQYKRSRTGMEGLPMNLWLVSHSCKLCPKLACFWDIGLLSTLSKSAFCCCDKTLTRGGKCLFLLTAKSQPGSVLGSEAILLQG